MTRRQCGCSAIWGPENDRTRMTECIISVMIRCEFDKLIGIEGRARSKTSIKQMPVGTTYYRYNHH